MPDTTLRRLAADLDVGGPHRRTALRRRVHQLLTAFDAGVPAEASSRTLLGALADAVDGTDPSRVWLTAAVLDGGLPTGETVLALRRRIRLDGLPAVLGGLLPRVQKGWPARRGPWRPVEVATGQTFVDLHHTADTSLATGIQRVARETARRWDRDHDVRVLTWTPMLTALTELTGDARTRALRGTPRTEGVAPGPLVVPWRCTYLLPELLIEPRRAARLEAMLTWSGGRSGFIGFDCVPITSAETIGDGMAGGFAGMLGAAAAADAVTCISEAAATEYRGWRQMLGGAGRTGPDIAAIALPVDDERADDAAVAEAHRLFRRPGLPLALVVGSHEPRKNHLAVLHAAELLWRRGVRFSLVFIGGNSWRSERFTAELARLQAAGRPVESHSGLSDRLLWAAYRVARVTLFPSLNEGYGLPVSESLACGTPVVTSGYGSMREIAEEGGALLVDPRDDDDIAAALQRVLTDDVLHAELTARARARAHRSWDAYAEQTWAFLTGAAGPGDDPGHDDGHDAGTATGRHAAAGRSAA